MELVEAIKKIHSLDIECKERFPDLDREIFYFFVGKILDEDTKEVKAVNKQQRVGRAKKSKRSKK